MKKFLYAAMAATVLFASCAKDGSETTPAGGGQEGGKATLILKMAFPRTYAESAATAGESKVNTVDVFIFNKADGSLVNHKPLTDADFTPSGNDYVANDGIETTAGAKLIGIGINLPATIVSNINNTVKNASAVESYVYSVTASSIAAPNSFVMFSTEMADETLKADDDPGFVSGTDNVISVDIERMAGKGAVATTAAYTPAVGSLATVNALEYRLMQTNTKSYLMRNADGKDPNYVSSDFITSGVPSGTQYDASVFENTVAADYIAVGAVTSYAADFSDCPAFYGAENTSDFYQKGTSTYFLVRAQVTPNDIVDGTNTSQGAGTPGASFYMVTDGTTTLFTANPIDAGALSNNATAFPGGPSSVDVTTYTDGYCYYSVFVGSASAPGNTGRAFLRNNFHIGQIKAINGIGKSTEPEVIVPPTAPVDGELATIDVEFKVLNWTLNPGDEVELE